jgi:rhodanese-related sulfurtransferase
VNCAGRTRSIIGTQSLINAGIPNEVNALRNGTIGWTLAGQELDKGQSRRFKEVSENTASEASARARSVADRANVKRTTLAEIAKWQSQAERTTYFFDTRTPEEYEAGHLPGFRSVPGGQLVQETEMVAPVRGARIVLADPSSSVRANMPASWLAQMAWDVYVVDGLKTSDLSETGVRKAPLPTLPQVQFVDAATVSNWLKTDSNTIAVDFSTHANYVKAHIPGSWYALRSQLADAIKKLPQVDRYVLTSTPTQLSIFVAQEFQSLTQSEVLVLEGGNTAWADGGFELEKGASRLASPPLDRYKRPYEGTSVDPAAMQAYLDWEFGLVAQLGKDGTHHFWVL